MQKGLWILFLAFFAFLCRAQEPLTAWSDDTRTAWWAKNPSSNQWPQAAADLTAQLEANYRQSGVSSFSNPDFQDWMEHLEWIRLGLACPDVLANADNLKTFVALGKDETISHLFVEKMVPLDVKKIALQNLLRLAQANMADLHEYAALGVAYSLVFDEPFPSYWPHAQVDRSAVPIGDLDIIKRFQFYVQANRDKKTELDLTQLPVEDLKYLVDSEVNLSELEYAQANTIPYEKFDDAFFSINYVTSRIAEGNQVMNWPLPTYTLQDIEKNGGICVDQAYYAYTLGKGRGIPTIFFTGQGSDGGHAWFGYLAKDGKWKLDCGRYANQNYPKGFALDPQTWQVVNDITLEYLAKGGTDSRYQPAKVALAWAQLHVGTPSYRPILEDARSIMPELTETWEDEGDYLDKADDVSIDDKKAFYQSWITQFNSYADLKVEGQKRLLRVLKAANDPDAESLQQDIILQNRDSSFDLGVQGSLGEIDDKFKAQDWDGAKLKFETAVRDFKDQGGGTFYNNVIEPYVMECLQYGRQDQADDGLHFTEERMPMESLLQQEFEKLKDIVKSSPDIFGAMEKWLEELDSDDYAQAWSDGSSTFQHFATSDQFTALMNARRKPFGKCSSRALSAPPRLYSLEKLSSGQTLEGDFLMAQYTGTFDNNVTAQERVTFTRDSDGTWRVLFYGIRAAAPSSE